MTLGLTKVSNTITLDSALIKDISSGVRKERTNCTLEARTLSRVQKGSEDATSPIVCSKYMQCTMVSS